VYQWCEFKSRRGKNKNYFDSEPTNLCSFSVVLRAERRCNKYQCYSPWFDPTGPLIHDLPHSKRARETLRHRCGAIDWCYHVNILCHSDSSPPLTACTILVIVIDSSFVEQVEEYTCHLDWFFWNFGIQYKVDNFLHLSEYSVMTE
jgi:hypothetical protein